MRLNPYSGYLFSSREKSGLSCREINWVGTCNLRCLHCYGPLKKEKPLPLEKLLTLISKFQELKLSWVVITGGEPLIVPNIDIVMRTLKQTGVKIALSTNSTFFRRFQTLIEECVSSLNIPLDGSTPQIHAASRMDERSFHTFFDVLEHYRHCPERKPEILRIGSVYSKATHGDFVAMARLLEPYAHLIDTWKIYEIIDDEFQPEPRHPIMYEQNTSEKKWRSCFSRPTWRRRSRWHQRKAETRPTSWSTLEATWWYQPTRAG